MMAKLIVLFTTSCLIASVYSYSFVPALRSGHHHHVKLNSAIRSGNRANTLSMISTGDDRSERFSLDISKTIYTSNMKSPKDSYTAFAEKGASNAKMAKTKIFHQAALGGAYVGFGVLLSLSIAGNINGMGYFNPGTVKMAYASLFPVSFLFVVTTGAQLFSVSLYSANVSFLVLLSLQIF